MRTSVIFVTIAAVAMGLASAGCGNGKASDSAKVMNAMGSKASGGAASSLVGATMLSARDMTANLRGQAMLARFQAGAGLRPSILYTGPATSTDADFSCTATGSTGCTSACTFTCSTVADDQVACKDVTYTVAKGATFSMGLTIASSVYSFTLDLSGNVTGGDLKDGVKVACHLGMSFDLAKIQANPNDESNYTIDCNNADIKCTVGSDTINCNDLMKAEEKSENHCS